MSDIFDEIAAFSLFWVGLVVMFRSGWNFNFGRGGRRDLIGFVVGMIAMMIGLGWLLPQVIDRLSQRLTP